MHASRIMTRAGTPHARTHALPELSAYARKYSSPTLFVTALHQHPDHCSITAVTNASATWQLLAVCGKRTACPVLYVRAGADARCRGESRAECA